MRRIRTLIAIASGLCISSICVRAEPSLQPQTLTLINKVMATVVPSPSVTPSTNTFAQPVKSNNPCNVPNIEPGTSRPATQCEIDIMKKSLDALHSQKSNIHVGFQTPSGNVHCLFGSSTYQLGLQQPVKRGSWVRCDMKISFGEVPPKPSDCPYTWDNKAFFIAQDGNVGKHICRSDTVINDRAEILSYGSVWQNGGFTCKSEQSALTCINSSGHGFSLSKARQKLF